MYVNRYHYLCTNEKSNNSAYDCMNIGLDTGTYTKSGFIINQTNYDAAREELMRKNDNSSLFNIYVKPAIPQTDFMPQIHNIDYTKASNNFSPLINNNINKSQFNNSNNNTNLNNMSMHSNAANIYRTNQYTGLRQENKRTLSAPVNKVFPVSKSGINSPDLQHGQKQNEVIKPKPKIRSACPTNSLQNKRPASTVARLGTSKNLSLPNLSLSQGVLKRQSLKANQTHSGLQFFKEQLNDLLLTKYRGFSQFINYDGNCVITSPKNLLNVNTSSATISSSQSNQYNSLGSNKITHQNEQKFEELNSELFNMLLDAIAKDVSEATHVIIGAGAGFSADSGLATYKGIANVPAYRRMGLDYGDLCEPKWIKDDPEIFYGFWGYCWNLYHETKPHPGYNSVKNLANKMGKKLFIYTSNVDGHFLKVGISPTQIYEFHGTCDEWQCSKPCCYKASMASWKLDPKFRFPINMVTMRVKRINLNMLPSQNFNDEAPQSSGFCIAKTTDLSQNLHQITSNVSNFNPFTLYNPVKKVSDYETRNAVKKYFSQQKPGTPVKYLDSRYTNKEIRHQAELINSSFAAMLKQTYQPNIVEEIETWNSKSNIPIHIIDDNQTNENVGSTESNIDIKPEKIPSMEDLEEDLRSDNKSSYSGRYETIGINKKHPVCSDYATELYRHDCGYSTIEIPKPLLSEDDYIKPYSSHPTCLRCGALLRPRVLMFSDEGWLMKKSEDEQWKNFKKKLFIIKKNKPDVPIKKKKVVLLELGCGLRVPTIRDEFEKIVEKLSNQSNIESVSLYRINPFDVFVNKELKKNTNAMKNIIHLKANGSVVLQEIEKRIKDLKK